jgi:hypothetical protein
MAKIERNSPMAKLKHVDARVYNRITTKPKDDEEGVAD